MNNRYDVAVVGSGPGGYVAAIRAAQLGLRTICIEKEKELGGTCLNVGCIPSKALLHSTELLYRLQTEGKRNGLEGNLKADFSQMQKRKGEIVSSFNKGIEALFRKNKVERAVGAASFDGPNTLLLSDGSKIEASSIILATGSEPVPLPFLPFDEKKVLSSTGALSLEKPPKKLLVVGAGIIGVELGSVLRRLGSEVIFIEFLDRVCPSLDRTLSQHLEKILVKQGMQFYLSHKVVKGEVTKNQVELSIEGKDGPLSLIGDAALIAIGRRPYTKGLNLEKVGIEKDSKGFIVVDGCFRTKLSHIFAIGDLIDGPMLAHKASEEGVAVSEWIAGRASSIEYMAIPNVAYTYPEVAGVGLTEDAAKELGLSVRAATFPFKANSRAKCTDEEEGLVKMVMDQETHHLLGVHILGAHASELIHEAVLAIKEKLKVEVLAETCHAHPTLSEAIKEAALALTKGAIHI